GPVATLVTQPETHITLPVDNLWAIWGAFRVMCVTSVDKYGDVGGSCLECLDSSVLNDLP
ncbi:hypothetical protein RZS08_00590, partial [Arthrospira platensis SPKY1]|nr:hypothetical protein [Arthrospira platensis SPKY1]